MIRARLFGAIETPKSAGHFERESPIETGRCAIARQTGDSILYRPVKQNRRETIKIGAEPGYALILSGVHSIRN
jgi:hypothetical protein